MTATAGYCTRVPLQVLRSVEGDASVTPAVCACTKTVLSSASSLWTPSLPLADLHQSVPSLFAKIHVQRPRRRAASSSTEGALWAEEGPGTGARFLQGTCIETGGTGVLPGHGAGVKPVCELAAHSCGVAVYCLQAVGCHPDEAAGPA